jgi:hypothetical protein
MPNTQFPNPAVPEKIYNGTVGEPVARWRLGERALIVVESSGFITKDPKNPARWLFVP